MRILCAFAFRSLLGESSFTAPRPKLKAACRIDGHSARYALPLCFQSQYPARRTHHSASDFLFSINKAAMAIAMPNSVLSLLLGPTNTTNIYLPFRRQSKYPPNPLYFGSRPDLRTLSNHINCTLKQSHPLNQRTDFKWEFKIEPLVYTGN
jgi:hypothetical protein